MYGTRGMVSCSQPLAAEAGLRILQAGGNAADAAVAVAAALGVTEPCSTGVGWGWVCLDRQLRLKQGKPLLLCVYVFRQTRLQGKGSS